MDRPESDPRGDVTRLLQAARAGDVDALDRLVPILYDDLRALARHHLGRERAGHTLSATDVVHESFLRLASGAAAAVDRSHFLAIASRSMRQVLVDHARRLAAGKRGGGWARTTLSGAPQPLDLDAEELLALDAALDRLDPRQRQVVECRFFGGMEETEIATALGVSERTVRRDWVKARAWLYSTLYPDNRAPAGR
jgi:RNA polymerase sigma factor (TIGR02999 family)